MVEREDITVGTGVPTTDEPARPTLQARVTTLENALKSMLKELESHSLSLNIKGKLIEELQEEVGLNLPPETPSNPLSDDVPQEGFDRFVEDSRIF